MSRCSATTWRPCVGASFPDFHLLDHLSTLDNVALPLRVAGVPETQAREHVTELLRWVGLADRMDAKPHTLAAVENVNSHVEKRLIVHHDGSRGAFSRGCVGSARRARDGNRHNRREHYEPFDSGHLSSQ